MMYIAIILLALFTSTGIAFLIVNRNIFRSNQLGEKKPRLEAFGTNFFRVIHKGEDSKFFR